ncbi:MAG: hypothetical protein ACHQAU_05740 [Gammaproteobacteria bacterium]
MLPILLPKMRITARAERFMAWSVAATAILISLLFVRKIWQTNDDVAMAMVSQGYGIASVPSPGIVFSNVVWGWILTHMPAIAGLDPYSLATYTALIVSATAIALSLDHRQTPPLLAASVLVTMFVPTIATPQFTLTAGYLTIAGIAVLLAWKDSSSQTYLWVSGILLLMAGLIRPLEFMFVAVLSLPFLYLMRPIVIWRWLILVTVVVLLLLTAHFIDAAYYSSPAWSPFQQMNRIRVAFTDYGLLDYFRAHPDAVGNGNLDANDLTLVSRWFYPDPRVFNPAAFAAPLQAVKLTARLWMNLRNFRHLQMLLDTTQLMDLVALLLLSLAAFRSKLRPVIVALAMLMAAFLYFHVLGRSSVARVYVPAIATMAILYLLMIGRDERLLVRATGMTLLIAATAFTLWDLSPRMHGPDRQRATMETALCKLPQDRLWVAWGNSSFTYQLLYRPGLQSQPACELHFYALGTMQLAPSSQAMVEQYTGAPNVVAALLQGKHIYMFTEQDRLELLKRYFDEHYKTALNLELKLKIPHATVYDVWVGGPAAQRLEQSHPGQSDDDDTGGG